MIQFLLLISRQGKVRLSKFYTHMSQKERAKAVRDVCNLVISKPVKRCNFIEWKDSKIVWKRYASLYFVTCIEATDNELINLEVIHHFVEVLDKHFKNVCELDLIFNFHKAHYVLDEILLNGELQETSKQAILRMVNLQDSLADIDKDT
eukprot:TRINITY_DN114022_c0_g1_i1.p1 TRINITY_DN114022_c0_g1~~TRINITY_DN114022_c0_g1_i1.p1  ORF type:complete len:149 (+),score=2.35 TRINITY_DN114022_c0_g1_i1:56-502(+)